MTSEATKEEVEATTGGGGGTEEAGKVAPETEPKEEAAKEDAGEKKEDAAADESKDAKQKEEKKKEEIDPKVVEAVAERLRFFFSDANVRQDNFLRRFLMLPEGHYPRQVTVEALLRFNTIKQHTTDPAVVVLAAKSPLLADVLVVSKDGKAIGRAEPFTSAHRDGHIPVTLFVDKVPIALTADGDKKDTSAYAVSAQEVRDLFEPRYGTVALVKLRFHRDDCDDPDEDILPPSNNNRRRSGGGGGGRGGRGGGYNNRDKPQQYRKIATGSALVEFESLEGFEKAAADVLTFKSGGTTSPTAAAVAASGGDGGGEGKEAAADAAAAPAEPTGTEPKRKLKLGDSDLEVMTLRDVIDFKMKTRTNNSNNNRSPDRRDDRRDSSNKKDRRDDRDRRNEKEEIKPFTLDWKKGCVIKLTGLDSAKCDRESILDAISKATGLSVREVQDRKIYADYSRGQVDGAVRFLEPGEGDASVASLCKKLAAGELEVAGTKVGGASILDGDDEEKYWNEYVEFKNKQLKLRADERRGGGSHHRNNKRQRRS